MSPTPGLEYYSVQSMCHHQHHDARYLRLHFVLIINAECFVVLAAHGWLAQSLQVALAQAGVVMGEDGSKINDMSHAPALSLPCGQVVWNGSIDLAVSPYTVLGDSVIDQMRMGIGLIHTQEHKAAHDAQGSALPADLACMHPGSHLR